MGYRGHEPVTIDTFKGLFDQGDDEEAPLGYLCDGENLRFIGSKAIGVRYGVDMHQNVSVPLGNVVRIYNYITQDANTLLALTWDGTTGRIYHVVDTDSVFGPILTKTGMMDFAFVPYAGRAYISPFATFQASGGFNIEKGLDNEYLYVYLGAGVAAAPAGGVAPTGTFSTVNGTAGNTDAGFHLFGVVFETNTGYLTPPGAFNSFTTAAAFSVSFGTTTPIPLGASNVTKRHIVATKVITGYTGNTTGYQYFFIPTGTINDNTSTTLANMSFCDADLLEDASYLLDNFANPPAGASLSLYHNRLVLAATFDDISVAYVSFPGEPEAFSQVDGLLVLPPDGRPITNAQELRDILYVFKIGRTVSYVDNDDVPSSWPLSIVDQAMGTSVHGVAVVNDTGSSNVDFLIVATRRGIVVFNGRYIIPELSWVISELGLAQDPEDFRYIQILNAAVNQNIYVTLPDRRLLYGDYTNGMDPNQIRWMVWRFDFKVNTIALVNTSEIIIASEGGL
jgi:hypothetical protein